ncbi:hypothetical protein CCP3SC1_210017 [Gammaproteobacteria bacterium]
MQQLCDAALATEQWPQLPLEEGLMALVLFGDALNDIMATIEVIKEQTAEKVAPELAANTEFPPLDMKRIVPLVDGLFQQIRRNAYDTQEFLDTLRPHRTYTPADV